MRLTVVSTLYRSAKYLPEFCARASAAAQLISPDYEIILVNDGSPDDSVRVALQLRQNNPHITLIDLARNFGHHKAIMTGLAHADGDLVFLTDSDLEEAPEALNTFYNEMQAKHADVVYGVVRERAGSLFKRTAGALFFRIFNGLSDFHVPANVTMARLMTRDYVIALLQHRDREIYIGGLFALTGFTQVPFTMDKPYKGETTYTLSRRISQLVNAITSFSNKPLVLIFWLGCIVSFLGIAYAAFVILRKLLFGLSEGFATITASIWIVGGLTIFSVGVIGLYLAKIYSETKDRPYTIVRKVHRSETNLQK